MTAYWANSISTECGEEDHKALERRFAPSSKCCDPDEPVYTNLWLGYLRGRHVPVNILPIVNKTLPKANKCLRSPLWSLLADAAATSKQLLDLMQCLESEILELLRDSSQGHGCFKLAMKLERRASLDALAAEILLLRLSAIRGEARAAFYWGRYVWRMMLLLGPTFVEGGIAQALAELLEERITSQSRVDGKRFGFPPGSYYPLVWQYIAAIYRVLDLAPGTRSERLHVTGLGMLNGAFGSAYFWMFNPARVLC